MDTITFQPKILVQLWPLARFGSIVSVMWPLLLVCTCPGGNLRLLTVCHSLWIKICSLLKVHSKQIKPARGFVAILPLGMQLEIKSNICWNDGYKRNCERDYSESHLKMSNLAFLRDLKELISCVEDTTKANCKS